MAVVLRGRTGDFVFNNRGWVQILTLAYQRGWRPVGTLEPAHWSSVPPERRPSEWPAADYCNGKGQRVHPEDARALADALAAVVDDLPDHDPLENDIAHTLDVPGYPALRTRRSDRRLNPYEFFGGPNKEGFKAFIDFARTGGFAVW
ncbi:MAG: hypothetical protein R3B68_02420 [Phycisphaerales bacterium]